MAVRTIRVNLSADITNFTQNINNARTGISKLGSELNSNIARIKADMSRLNANLGTGATGYDRMGISVDKLKASLAMQTQYTNRVEAALDALRNKAGATSEQIRNMEMRLIKAATAEKEMQNQLEMLNRQMTFTGQIAEAMTGQFMSAGVAMSAAFTYPIEQAIQSGLKYNAMIQTNTTAFKTMTGSASEATGLIDQIQSMSMATPFRNEDLTKQATTLLQYGMNVKQVISMLKLLGDVSLGQKDKFEVIAYNFAQAMSLGRLQAIDARSMTLAGFNPITAIAALRQSKGSKESKSDIVSDIQKEMDEGKVKITELVDAMKIASGPSGRFFNALINAARTFDGQMSTLQDNWDRTKAALTKPLFEWLAADVLPAMNNLLLYVRKFAQVNPVFTKWALGLSLTLAAIGPLMLGIYGISRAWAFAEKGFTLVKTGAIALFKALKAGATASLRSTLLWALGLAAVGAVAYVVVRNWTQVKDFFVASFEVMKDQAVGFGDVVKGVFMEASLAASKSMDEIAAFVKAGAKGQWFVDGGWDVEQSGMTKVLQAQLDRAKENRKKLLQNEADAKAKLGQATEDLGASISKNFWDDFQKVKDSMPTFDMSAIKLDVPPVDTSAFEDSAKKGEVKVSAELRSFADKIKAQARSFRDALGLFDKAIIDKVSPERLLIRLKSQMKVFETWQASMNVLQKKLGRDSQMYMDILAKGPSAAGEAKALASNDMILAQYKALYQQKTNIALGQAGYLLGAQEREEKKLQQVLVNINGGVILDNVDHLVEIVTRQLKSQGLI